MGDTFRASMAGARGPAGAASGPLGANSVDSTHFKTAGGALTATRDLLGIIPKSSTGGFTISGYGVDGPRNDLSMAVIAAPSHHAAIGFYNSDHTDEWGLTGYMPDSIGADKQVGSIFSGMVGGVNTAATWVGYIGMHGESGAAGDNTPFLAGTDNSVVLCGGSTGGFQTALALRAPNYVYNVQSSKIQGGALMGDFAYSFLSQHLLQVRGFAFFGLADNTTKVATVGLSMGYSSGSGSSLILSYNNATASNAPCLYTASVHTISGGHMVPDVASTRNLGSASFPWNNGWIANAWTVTSDARLKKRVGDGAPSAAEREWARGIELLKFKWKAAIEEKGEDEARTHWGVFAQQVHEAGITAGVEEPFRYGFLTRDLLEERAEEMVKVEKPIEREVTDDRPVMEMIDGKPVITMRPSARMETKKRIEVVRDAEGKPLMVPDRTPGVTAPLSPILNRRGQHFAREVPMVEAMIEVDETHMVDEAVSVVRPVMIKRGKHKGEHEVRWGIRYESLLMFLHACARADADQMRGDMDALAARVSAIESRT